MLLQELSSEHVLWTGDLIVQTTAVVPPSWTPMPSPAGAPWAELSWRPEGREPVSVHGGQPSKDQAGWTPGLSSKMSSEHCVHAGPHVDQHHLHGWALREDLSAPPVQCHTH